MCLEEFTREANSPKKRWWLEKESIAQKKAISFFYIALGEAIKNSARKKAEHGYEVDKYKGLTTRVQGRLSNRKQTHGPQN